MNLRYLRRINHLCARVRDTYLSSTMTEISRYRREPSALRIRLAFIGVAFPLLSVASLLFIMILAHPDEVLMKRSRQDSVNLGHRFRSVIFAHRSTSLFLCGSFSVLQLIAILAAIRSWEAILFSYVVLTSIMGILVGMVATFGLITTYILMPYTSNYVTLITALLVLIFLIIFYLLASLGAKVMSHLKRYHGLRLSKRLAQNENEQNKEHDYFENINIDDENCDDEQIFIKIITPDYYYV